MKLMKNRFVILLFAAGIIVTSLGWCALSCVTGPQIIDFKYARDHNALEEIFQRDWDWLVPVSPEHYALDLVLKYRAPQQNPLYAGRLTLKVIYDKEHLVGFVGYYMKSNEEGFLNFLDINPEYRSKGYGALLARYAIDDMIKRGARRITIVTYPHNERALNLYQHLGFKEIRRDTQVELEYLV